MNPNIITGDQIAYFDGQREVQARVHRIDEVNQLVALREINSTGPEALVPLGLLAAGLRGKVIGLIRPVNVSF